ncbi:uncharacterized protein PFL1_06335 [Pseudozyma flocculosa PF-1]|uniref:DUF202 domain-containing protein n=2 Tax=Pseudozyma flocculosa TaxID=84751 RepID=A0A5C3F7J8_9BASI|nr:uncharacterized protein PFL1_06335 [Pseudozyma flocculosa PF-1]EPQ26127.1 hypothetical protein PFL1_06335 [Pseudozyma flocculosa PF-1]SPO40372.1 uncharacterized protein PSFLO_05854 [Pseudozyma flocculosa]
MSHVVAVLKSAWSSLNLELKNEGSVARDHLASERTFLAWLRTSLSLVSIGIALTQIFQIPSLVGHKSLSQRAHLLLLLQQQQQSGDYLEADDALLPREVHRDLARLGKPVGGAFIILGTIVLLLGCRRYFVVQGQLTRGKFPPSKLSISITAGLAGALIIAATSVVLVGERT